MHLRCINPKEPWILFEIHKNEHRFIGCKGHPSTSSRKSWKRKIEAISQGLALLASPIRLCLIGIPIIFEKDAQKGDYGSLSVRWSFDRLNGSRPLKGIKKHPRTVGFENVNSGVNHCLDGCEILFQKVQGKRAKILLTPYHKWNYWAT